MTLTMKKESKEKLTPMPQTQADATVRRHHFLLAEVQRALECRGDAGAVGAGCDELQGCRDGDVDGCHRLRARARRSALGLWMCGLVFRLSKFHGLTWVHGDCFCKYGVELRRLCNSSLCILNLAGSLFDRRLRLASFHRMAGKSRR